MDSLALQLFSDMLTANFQYNFMKPFDIFKQCSKLFDLVCQDTSNRINFIVNPLPFILMGYDQSFKLLVCSLIYVVIENQYASDIQVEVSLHKDSSGIEVQLEVDFYNKKISKSSFKSLASNVVNDYTYKKLKKQLTKYNPIMLATGAAVYVLAGKLAIKTVD